MITSSSTDVAQLFKAGMRKFASGVCLITSFHNGKRVGLIATAVNSVSMDPPTLLICVNRTASAFDAISEAGHFCVNVLTVDNLDLAGQFSNSDRRHERFQNGGWAEMETGSPALEEALVSFDCKIVQQIPYHSHTIFLGEVKGVKVVEEGCSPLLYLDRQFRNIAAEALA